MKMITVIRFAFNPNKILRPDEPRSAAFYPYGTVIPESELNLEKRTERSR